jgi:hypothetical protein
MNPVMLIACLQRHPCRKEISCEGRLLAEAAIKGSSGVPMKLQQNREPIHSTSNAFRQKVPDAMSGIKGL